MARIIQRCIWCSQRMQVSTEVYTTTCPVCQTVNPVRSRDPIQRQSSLTMTHSPMLPSVYGKKRAVLCGVSYRFRKCELKGTANDVNCMRTLLRDKFSFPDNCILVLSEDEKNPLQIPTKQNIRNAMRWLVQGCQPGDSLVFHFSGLGVQQLDQDEDEVDGYDEAICPMDYETSGTIVDDEINEVLVRQLPRGAKLHAIIDASHSGTVLDLPYVYKIARDGLCQWVNQNLPSTYKGTNGGLAISFSSCRDDQTSDDTSAYSVNATTGAMTYCFVQALESKPGATYGELLNSMRFSIGEVQKGILNCGPIASLLRKMLRTGFSADPQLSASEQFDAYSKPFTL
ncbi:metacaspase-1-like [Aristolochia californica]|uniref:metacaspase-1-like n=1 Tax=Aristolochia californica TaxID=171875 RepID=UPI0035E16F7A